MVVLALVRRSRIVTALVIAAWSFGGGERAPTIPNLTPATPR